MTPYVLTTLAFKQTVLRPQLFNSLRQFILQLVIFYTHIYLYSYSVLYPHIHAHKDRKVLNNLNLQFHPPNTITCELHYYKIKNSTRCSLNQKTSQQQISGIMIRLLAINPNKLVCYCLIYIGIVQFGAANLSILYILDQFPE